MYWETKYFAHRSVRSHPPATIINGAAIDEAGLYTDRIAGRHRHYRNSGCHLVPVLNSAQNRAARTTCLNNLKQINQGVRLYADEHGDVLTLVSTNHSPNVWTDYQSWMKGYVGLNGPSSPNDALFACPADTYYYFDYTLIPQGRHLQPQYNYSSYAFNAGNIRADYPYTNQFPGIAGQNLTSIKHPARTVLVTEFSSLDPYSWHNHQHEPSGRLGASGSRNVVSFVDGHANYITMYWDTNVAIGHVQAWHYNPPVSYDYQWSGD